MEGKIQSKTPQENGAKLDDQAEDVKPPEKEDVKTTKRSPSTRSRSRTPQITKSDDAKDKKKAGPNLKKVAEEDTSNGHEERKSQRSDRKESDNETEEEPSNGHGERKSRRSEKKEKKESDTDAKGETSNSHAERKSRRLEKKESDKETPVENREEEKPESDGVKTSEGPAAEQPVEVKRTSPRKRDKPEDSVAAEAPSKQNEGEDMEPLVLGTDEPDPELQFDETSDQESGPGSPGLSRCKTRRSHTRNIPTPKTPKSVDLEPEKTPLPPTPDYLESETTEPENLNETIDSLAVANASTRVEVGSDVTRLNYMAENESVLGDDQEYLDSIRERSLRDTFRNLSRRSIHSLGSDSYRHRAIMRNHQTNSGFLANNSAPSLKRKRRSVSPDERKKFKSQLPPRSFLSNTFRSWFLPETGPASPKLTAYKDESKDIHEEIKEPDEGINSNRCSIM